MRKKYVRWLTVGLPLILLLTLPGCRRVTAPATAANVLDAMSALVGAAESHAIYTRTSDPNGATYLSDTLFSALYGEAARGLLCAGEDTPAAINDAAILLSVSPTPTELAVFRCSDARGTATAAKLARTRLDTVRGAWSDTELADIPTRGIVAVRDGYVLLVIAANPDKVLARAERAIRQGGLG